MREQLWKDFKKAALPLIVATLETEDVLEEVVEGFKYRDVSNLQLAKIVYEQFFDIWWLSYYELANELRYLLEVY